MEIVMLLIQHNTGLIDLFHEFIGNGKGTLLVAGIDCLFDRSI